MESVVIMLVITLIFASPFIILNIILNKIKMHQEDKRLQKNIRKALRDKE